MDFTASLVSSAMKRVVQFIEGGHVRRPRSLVEIAKVLGVNPEWLLLGEGLVDVAVRETQGGYQGEPTLSDEAVAVARLWMELPHSQRVAVKETLLALLKAQA